MRSLAGLLPAEIGKVVSRHIEERAYQVEIAELTLKGLRRGSNVIIVLPSGLGKTLISQVVATAWAKSRPETSCKVLVVVPSRLSLNLYPAHTSWLEKYLKVQALDESNQGASIETKQNLDQANMLVSTPRKLINGLVHNEIPFGKLKEFSLVVIDNYDALASLAHPQFKGLRNDIEMLMTFLVVSSPRFLLLSTHYQAQSSRVHDWENILKPVEVRADPELYREYIPLVNIRLKGIIDPGVTNADKMLRRSMAINMEKIKEHITGHTKNQHPVRWRDVLEQMRDIASGRQKELYLHFRKLPTLVIPVDEVTRKAFQNLARVVMVRIQLFEDLWSDWETDSDAAKAPSGFRGRRVNLNGKMKAIKEIAQERGDKRGLILSRNLEMCELLAGTIINQGLPAYILHKDLASAELNKRVEGFKKHKAAVLLTPRLPGGRSMDVSHVDYAVFYSPKDEEAVMWQEMASIQSVRKHPKEVFILFYRNTGEETKLKRLLWKMKGNSNYRFMKATSSESGAAL